MSRQLRIPVVYFFAIPLALVLGCLVSSPDPITFATLGMILFFLALPLLLKWHHAFLIIGWNTAFNFFFLPGQPDAWLVLSAISFAISGLNYFMFQKDFLHVPELTRPLLFLAAVVLATACYRGGIGLRVLGAGSIGGRYYIFILGAIGGYFALTAEAIQIGKAATLSGLYFLSGTTTVLGNLAFTLGPAFYFFYYFVSATIATGQAANEVGVTGIDRILGLAPACTSLFCFLLIRYSLRGLFDWTKPWRLLLLCLTIGAAFFAGFRSGIMLLFLIFAFQFYFEGLLRTRLCMVLVTSAFVGFVLLFLFASKMPMAVQRAVSFLPVNVDAEVLEDAKGSADWRFEMWAVVWKDVPKYLIIGKGYGIDPTDMFLTTEAIRMGMLNSIEEPLLAGDYHSGPLSILVPFGIVGVVAFLWVLGAGGWALYSNYRYGDGRLRQINRVLLSYYLASAVSFFLIFGAFNTQLFIFLGLMGLSVSLNGGVKRTAVVAARRFMMPEIVSIE